MKNNVQKVLLIMIFLIPLVLTFGSYGLYNWSVSLDGDMGYRFFYVPLKSLNDKAASLGLTGLVEGGREGFSHWQELTFHPPEGLEEETELVVAPLPEPEGPLFEGETLDILVIGDSLANSVGKKLEPMMNDYSDMTCRVEGVISSNLIRLDYYDWLNEAPRLTKENAPDCVLIFLGANTMQSFYLDGTNAPLFSDRWVEIYKERAGILLDSLNELEVDVFWMDLPPMQKEGYNNNISHLNGLIDAVCLQKEVKRFNYNSLLTDSSGVYTSEQVVDGRQILVRSDGIHFTLAGASYVSEYLIDILREWYELPDPVLQVEAIGEEEVLNSQEIPL
ncbi:MAG: DUF459 domain-containing protein [Spirochaetales bacterium]|nr:DUF459 domain-containing protein [Spirochaetales bacterium]